MKTKPQFRGSIILLHDGGGDRSATVAALPVLIDALRAHGYTIVPVSALMGKTTAEVMPPAHLLAALRACPTPSPSPRLDFIGNFIVMVFFVGDILMSARLISSASSPSSTACASRTEPPRPASIRASPCSSPPTTKRRSSCAPSARCSTPTTRTSTSSSSTTARGPHRRSGARAYAAEIAAGRVQVLTKPNGGKAAALNYALDRIDEEIYVGIDADTVIAADAISKLIPHFEDPRIGAIAGNAKVGNRVNLWTRWQALEYITSQNFERRALDLFHVVTVVPGAIGAWRTAPSRPPAAIRSTPSPKTPTSP
jgi:peptidoglycan-N-acetylglucosamine deacetylase